MALLNAAGCSYLTFGYEPLTESGEIYGMPEWIQKLTRKIHKSVFQGLKVSGKKGYYDKWCPDEEQKTGLHLIFPAGTPGIQDIVAVMHFANISVKGLVFRKLKQTVRKQKGATEKDTTENERSKKESTKKDTTERSATQAITADAGSVEPASTNNQKEQNAGENSSKDKPVKEKPLKKKQKAKKISENDTTGDTALEMSTALGETQVDSGVEVSPDRSNEIRERCPDTSEGNGTINVELGEKIVHGNDVSNSQQPPVPVRHPEHVAEIH
jgi:hypothetical protein